MPNIAQVLKEEISRLARKEAKQAQDANKKQFAEMKQSIRELKTRVDTLEKENKTLKKAQAKTTGKEDTGEQSPPNIRITAKGILSLRKKLKLSQAELAALLGVSAQSVHQWERKEGRLSFRRATLARLAEVKEYGIRDARRALEEMGQ
ncbi:MAG: helix-turn-helix domain-containing protein [Spartobacteria bacterium]|nr:helix-turn-helix domain-containing protein [Spartobacteria bacterium]